MMSDFGVIETALHELPATCKYHGLDLDPHQGSPLHYISCCDSGRPAVRRKKAEAALWRLRGVIERLEIEKHDLVEKLAGRDGAR